MMRERWPRFAAVSVVITALLVACRVGAATPVAVPAPAASPTAAAGAEQLRVEVVAAYPHDPQAFTQGLLLHDGTLYESTGLIGRSSLRQVELSTGKVLRRVEVPPPLFGEGLAAVGDRLVQLTWENHVALVYELATLQQVQTFAYPTEGWGLCFDGTQLIMSDGSPRLYYRDPRTFDARGVLEVVRNGRPLSRLNELECVGDAIYANVWTTDSIVRIDKSTGAVTAEIDAAGLLTAAERSKADVLNGIAYDASSGTFLITGKLWPRLFRVRFVPK
jgi:glutamine cyclotransferase